MTHLEPQFWQILWFIALYFGMTLAVYVVLTLKSRLHAKGWRNAYDEKTVKSSNRKISFIVPACNEELAIADTVRALLMLPGNRVRVVVVNDGSTDKTLNVLLKEFGLVPIQAKPRTRISPVMPTQLFQSSVDSSLIVIDKPNSGKSDSINVALQYVDTEYFAVSDADTVWLRDSLDAFIFEIEEESKDGSRVVAIGGLVQLLNGNHNWLTKIQTVEYMRAFLVGRLSWNQSNQVHLISGAAGVFHTETTLRLGGLPVHSQTEDLELTLLMHKHCQSHNIPYKVRMIPQFVCKTIAPDNLKVLIRQRLRWQRGLVRALWDYKFSFINSKGIGFHLFSMGYLFWIEALAPFVALFAMSVWFVMLKLQFISVIFLLNTFVISVLVGWMGSFLALFVVPVDHVLSRKFKFHHFVFYSFIEMIVMYPMFLFVRIWAGLTGIVESNSNWKGSEN